MIKRIKRTFYVDCSEEDINDAKKIQERLIGEILY